MHLLVVGDGRGKLVGMQPFLRVHMLESHQRPTLNGRPLNTVHALWSAE